MNKFVLPSGQELILTVTKLSVNQTAMATKHKTEKGNKITDNVTQENDTFQLDIVIKGLGQTDRTVNDWFTEFNLLKKIKKESIPVKLVTNYETFDNLVITSFPYERTAQTGKTLRTTLTLEQIRTTQTETVSNQNIKDADLKNRLFPKSVNGLKNFVPASISLTDYTNKLIDPNITQYKPMFKL